VNNIVLKFAVIQPSAGKKHAFEKVATCTIFSNYENCEIWYFEN